jgi:hypothetical protein
MQKWNLTCLENKICNKCNLEKPISEFYFRKDNNKYRRECKDCFDSEIKFIPTKFCQFCNKPLQDKNNIMACRKHRHISPEYKKQRGINQGEQKFCIKCNKSLKLSNITGYCTKHQYLIPSNKEAKREYELKNKIKIKEKRKPYEREWQRQRRKDPIQKIKDSLRRRCSDILKGKLKTGSFVRDLGCSIEEFRLYIENQFEPGMDWNNYGNKKGQWNIDHVIPLKLFNLTDRMEFLEACTYLNLRPLWSTDNYKKSNRLDYEK